MRASLWHRRVYARASASGAARRALRPMCQAMIASHPSSASMKAHPR